MIRKLVEKLFWRYQEKDNWRMKMNEPIANQKAYQGRSAKSPSQKKTSEHSIIFFKKRRSKRVSFFFLKHWVVRLHVVYEFLIIFYSEVSIFFGIPWLIK